MWIFLVWIWARTLLQQISACSCVCSGCTFWCSKSQNCGPWSQTPPKGKRAAQRRGLRWPTRGRRQPVALTLTHFGSVMAVTSPQIPLPVWAGPDRPDLCLTALPAGTMTDRSPAHLPFSNLVHLCLRTLTDSHNMQISSVCSHSFYSSSARIRLKTKRDSGY